MYNLKSMLKGQFIFMALTLQGIKCTIDGTTNHRRINDTKTPEDPCNPLYWYPQPIPEHCQYKNMPTPPGPKRDDNMPIPVPIPVPVPIPPQMPIPIPIPPPPIVPPIIMPPSAVPPGSPPPLMVPQPMMPLPMPLPFGIPLAPTNPMVPVAGIPLPPQVYPYTPAFPAPYPPMPPMYPAPYPPPYPAPYPPYPSPYASPYPMPPRRGMGMVPGIPGMVSPDGGINILPFSDAYSDMLEKHKQKMIRKHLHRLINEYDNFPLKLHKKARRHNTKEEKPEDNNTIE